MMWRNGVGLFLRFIETLFLAIVVFSAGGTRCIVWLFNIHLSVDGRECLEVYRDLSSCPVFLQSVDVYEIRHAEQHD